MDGGHPQAVAGDLPQFILVPGDAAAASPQGEGGPHDDRVANLMGEFQGGLQVGHHQGGDDRLADPLHRVLEKLAVLRLVDGIGIGSQQPDAVFREESLFRELHGQGQPGLSAQGGQQAVRLLLPDDPLDRLQGQGFDVDLIRHGAVGHDGGGVGVDQHHREALFPQGAAGLGPGVVELRRLPDDDGTGADHQHLMDIRIARHLTSPPSSDRGTGRTGILYPGDRPPLRDGTGPKKPDGSGTRSPRRFYRCH